MTRPNPIGVISMFYARPFGREHFSLFARMKAAGCDFVELLVPEPGELDLVETRKALADNGLAVALAARVNLTRDLSSADPEAAEAGIRYLETCVDVAAELGAGIVGGPLYGAPLVFAGRPPAPVGRNGAQRRIDQIVGGLKVAGRRATDKGVTLAIESLNRFETDIANTTGHALALAEAVDMDSVGVMLDTFHMNMEDPDIPSAIRRAGRRMVHFQANENNRGFVGSGHIDWPAVARALVAVNYTGPITLEPFRRDDERPGVPLGPVARTAEGRGRRARRQHRLSRRRAHVRPEGLTMTMRIGWGRLRHPRQRDAAAPDHALRRVAGGDVRHRRGQARPHGAALRRAGGRPDPRLEGSAGARRPRRGGHRRRPGRAPRHGHRRAGAGTAGVPGEATGPHGRRRRPAGTRRQALGASLASWAS